MRCTVPLRRVLEGMERRSPLADAWPLLEELSADPNVAAVLAAAVRWKSGQADERVGALLCRAVNDG